MAKGKLILICQFGGKFVTNDGGSMSYIEGDADTVNIHGDTTFEELKSNIAERLNLDYETLSIKYFLPQNRKTLITLSNDKDVKRMIGFYGDSLTADVFVMGEEGFKQKAVSEDISRVNMKKSTKKNKLIAGSQLTVFTPAYSESAIDTTIQSPTTSNPSLDTSSDDSDSEDSSTPDHDTDADYKSSITPVIMDMKCSPADTVKKRRRTASLIIGANSSVIDAIPETTVKNRVVVSRKKKTKNQKIVAVIDDVDNVSNEEDIISYEDDGSVESLIASWKHGLYGVDQDFKNVGEVRDALQKYAIAHRFGYKLKKNDTSRFRAICATEGCPWMIYASWVPCFEVFRVQKMNKSHTCGGESWKSAHTPTKWLVNIIKDRLRDSPHHKPQEIANSISRDFGIEVKYSQVWRGVDDVRQQLQGSHKESYNQLPWLCKKIIETNPGSVAKLVTNNEKRFQRLFVSFHASVHGFQNGCRPLIFLESMSLKSKYQEILIVANGVDGDDGFFPVAFAIMDNENDQNWCWFLEELKFALSSNRPITFISDREKGLRNSILEVFEDGHYGYSMHHLFESYKKNLKGPFHGDGRNVLLGSFLDASRTVRQDGFKKFSEQIKLVSPTAYDWVMQIEPEYWSSATFKGEPYNHLIASFTESYTKVIEEVRKLPIIAIIEALSFMMVELMENGKKVSRKLSTKLTSSGEVKLREETLIANGLKVLCSSDKLFEVHDHGDSINVVNIDKLNCTCLKWETTGLPCRHAIAVFNCKCMNVYDFCSKDFTAERLCLTYSESIYPLPSNGKDEIEEDDTSEKSDVLPPFISRTQGKRKREDAKKEQVLKRVVFCTKCKEAGHNKATCKAII